MLAYLTVRNFALVSDLEMRFLGGLTVITGESGAGKSILLGALGLVLGQRLSKSQIKPGASECEVTAEFDIQGAPNALDLLYSQDLVDRDDPHRCVVRRIANRDGRSRAWINSTSVTLGELRELCTTMVAIHTQFAQQQLMQTEKQLRWFDDFLAKPDLVNQVATHFEEWRQAESDCESLRKQSEAVNSRRELLEYQVQELADFDPREDEFQQLDAKFKRLNQRQTLLATVSQIITSLEERGIPSIVQSKIDLERMEDSSTDLQSANQLLNSVDVELEESLNHLKRYHESLESIDEPIGQIAERLDQYHALARKHRVPSGELFEKKQNLQDELRRIESNDDLLKSTQKIVKIAHKTFLETAKCLSGERKLAIAPFIKSVTATLTDIGMKDAQFQLGFSESESEHGTESVEFLVSANPGYAPAPLKRVASGGEVSRISLALLAVVAARSKLPCLVLDEADVGVGGTSADEVGRMLRKLASHTQVLCVTHAPQVAALGDSHVRVTKSGDQEVTVRELTDQSRIEEIARMVGGREINDDSRKYASVLLSEAQASHQHAST